MVNDDTPILAGRCPTCERCEECGSDEWGRWDFRPGTDLNNARFAHCRGCGAYGPVPGEPESQAAFEAEVAAIRAEREAREVREEPGTISVNEACGCTIAGIGTRERPWRIAYCDAHAAVRQAGERK